MVRTANENHGHHAGWIPRNTKSAEARCYGYVTRNDSHGRPYGSPYITQQHTKREGNITSFLLQSYVVLQNSKPAAAHLTPCAPTSVRQKMHITH